MEFCVFGVFYVFQDVYQPLAWIYVCHFAATQQCVEYCSIACCIVVAAEKIVFSSQGHRPDAVFNEIIIDKEPSLVNVPDQSWP